jgi:hypothetical protein
MRAPGKPAETPNGTPKQTGQQPKLTKNPAYQFATSKSSALCLRKSGLFETKQDLSCAATYLFNENMSSPQTSKTLQGCTYPKRGQAGLGQGPTTNMDHNALVCAVIVCVLFVVCVCVCVSFGLRGCGPVSACAIVCLPICALCWCVRTFVCVCVFKLPLGDALKTMQFHLVLVS